MSAQYTNIAQDLPGLHITAEKRFEIMKSDFAKYATKVDFLTKNDGYCYVLGSFGKSLDTLEWRIWKSLRDISKSEEFLLETGDENEAKTMFKSIIDGDFLLNKKLEKDLEKSIEKGGFGSGRKYSGGAKKKVTNKGPLKSNWGLYSGSTVATKELNGYSKKMTDIFNNPKASKLGKQAAAMNFIRNYERAVDDSRHDGTGIGDTAVRDNVVEHTIDVLLSGGFTTDEVNDILNRTGYVVNKDKMDRS